LIAQLADLRQNDRKWIADMTECIPTFCCTETPKLCLILQPVQDA